MRRPEGSLQGSSLSSHHAYSPEDGTQDSRLEYEWLSHLTSPVNTFVNMDPCLRVTLGERERLLLCPPTLSALLSHPQASLQAFALR